MKCLVVNIAGLYSIYKDMKIKSEDSSVELTDFDGVRSFISLQYANLGDVHCLTLMDAISLIEDQARYTFDDDYEATHPLLKPNNAKITPEQLEHLEELSNRMAYDEMKSQENRNETC